MTIDLDLEKMTIDAVRDGFQKGISGSFNYNGTMQKLMDAAIEKFKPAIANLLHEGLTSAIDDQQFREDIKTATRHALAKLLVQRFGGELEKQVNVLKSDPTTRARIVMAIEEIVKSGVPTP